MPMKGKTKTQILRDKRVANSYAMKMKAKAVKKKK